MLDFFVLSLPDNALLKSSPFIIHKAFLSIGGNSKPIKKLRSGDLLIDTTSALQSKYFLTATKFVDTPVSVVPHSVLNNCRGVISESDLLPCTDAEILNGFADQAGGPAQILRQTGFFIPCSQIRSQNSLKVIAIPSCDPSLQN
ncbi:hypothetical protein AVEN_54649-2 [Araneus ventricosus]|uniref:Uncharacterized protein n=1 Tax=Araneus ventricosus TaxID=182803 RepID=A0A4Y2BNK2_ARAVE|nr:hypothetical protein AVEN_54649-2 [Araneus ventricosus]